VNNGSGAVTQSFVVNFYSALTGTFAPLTDTLVESLPPSGVGATPAPWQLHPDNPALGMNQTNIIYAVRCGAIVTETNEGITLQHCRGCSSSAHQTLLHRCTRFSSRPIQAGKRSYQHCAGVVQDNGNGTVSFVGKDVISGVTRAWTNTGRG